MPNKGQVYDQHGKANAGVKYLYRQGPLQFQLRDKGFSYEIFRKKDKTENDWDITRLDLAMQYAGQATPLQFDWKGADELEDASHYYNHLGRFENLKRARKVTGVSKDKNVKLVFEVSADGKVKYDIWVKSSVARMLRLSGHEQSRLLASNRPDKVSFIFFDDTIEESIPKVALMRNGAEAAVADAGWAQAENEQTLKIVLPEGTSWKEADWVVIDPLPILRWATYYGGSSNDQGYGSAATPDGEVVYCGKTSSTNANVIASSGAYKTTNSGSDDAFIVKMKRNGGTSQRVWGTYFGGTRADGAEDVAVDLIGNVLVTGFTNSSGLGFNANYDGSYSSGTDAIIIKFTSSGTLTWCNYLGGTSDDEGLGIATDSANNVIIVGKTESTLLSSNAAGYSIYQSSNRGLGDGFIAKLDKDGNRYFVTYYGGPDIDDLSDVITSRKDTIVVVGTTGSSSDIVPTGTFQGNTYSLLNDAFIVKLTATGARVQARYFGDIQNDFGYNVYYKSGNYFMVGKTNSSANIASSGAHQILLNSTGSGTNTDGYLLKLSPNFNRLWATYYGGTANDGASSMAIDDYNYIYFCGATGSSAGIATSDAYQRSKSGGGDAYVAKFSDGGKRIWGTYFGGMNDDAATDIAHGKFADVFFVGITESDTNLVKFPFQATYGQATDAYFGDLYYCKKFAMLRKDTVCLNDTFSIKFTDSTNKNNWNRSFNKHRFLWTGPNNFSLPGNKPYNLQTARRKALWKDTGIYQLIVTDSFGCKDTARIRINYFYPLPIDTIQSSKNYCKWDTIKFKATAGPWARSNYQFYWRSLDNVFKSGNKRDTLRYPALKGKSDGRYELRIKDHLGCTTLDTFIINVGPTATLSSNSPVCPKGPIDLKATGSRLKKVVWRGPNNYLDSGISVKILNADKSKMGKYTAIVTDSSNCKDTLTITTTLFQLDSLLITRNAPVCAGDTLKITASMRSVTSRYSYKWTGPSSFVSTTRFVVIAKPTTANGGTYKLEVTDNASGCVLDTSISITVRSLPIANIRTNAPVCEGGRFTIRSHPSGGGGSGYQFTWTTARGITRTDTGLIFNPVTRADSGVYRLRLRDVNGCTKDTSIVFALKMLPDVGFTPNKDSQCLKSATFTFTNTTVLTSGTFQNFTWKTQNFTDTLLTNKNAISRKYNASGRYKITLIARSTDGCIDSLTKFVGVYPEPTLSWDIVSNDTQCLKRNAFEFDDKSTISKGTLTRFWTFGDGGKSSADPAKYSYTTPGDFTVKLKVVSGFGCSDSSTKKVRVNDNPKAAISVNNSTQCFSGNRFIFTDISTISAGWKMNGRKWNVGAGFADTTKKDTASFSSAGNFTVSLAVISADGCTDTAKTVVTVQSTPTAGAIGSDQTICNGGNPVAFTSTTAGTGSGTITYRWESSTNSGASWTTVSGATGATYDVPAGLTTTTQYRRITISTQNSVPCESAATTHVTVNVQSVVAAGAIGSSQTICNGGDPVAFTSTTAGNGSGTITYRWESSTNGGGTWTAISGATSDVYDVPAGLTATTHYRRITISTLNGVLCESVATAQVIVTVQSVPTAGVIGSSQTICDGGNPVAFTSTTNGAGSGTVTYRWESSTNSGASWTAIAGATGATYDVPAGLTTTTQYRRITISTLNGVPCESVATSPVTVNVQSPVTAGAIGSDQTICNGGNPVAFTSTTNGSGSGAITYRWESSTNGGSSWTTVTGATGATYDVPAGLTTTTQYRRITISTLNGVPCESVATAHVTVNVQSAVTAGAISASQTICNGGDPVAFTSTTAGNGSGTITYRWESSTNGGGTWTTISGATGTTYDEPAGLTTTTHYRRVTISTLNLVPCETPTSAVIVNVQSIVTAGAIGSDQTICGGGNPSAFTSTTNGSGSGTITYRWESSTNSGGSWTTVTGATGATYDVPAGLSTTTQYRRITISTLNGVLCESGATTAVTVTVQGSATAGAIGSDQTICNGGNPAAFTSITAGSGSGTITYRWESSTNGGGTWTTITGATADVYDAPAGLATTTHYRRVTISTLNSVPCETPTTAVIVTVQSIVTAGAISSSQTICDGGNPVAFTSTTNGAGSGTVTYRWESSTNSGASWTAIAGATGATYDVPAGLTTTTQYRRITISTLNSVVCESGATAVVTVTVQSPVTAGAIGSDQTICSGGDPVAFISSTAGTGSGTITYRWEASTNSGATWTTVTGATGATYDVPAGLTTTTQYRRITISTLNGVPCESVATTHVTVNVQSTVTAGAISASQTICNGGDPVAFTSTTAGNGSGTITYRWESSTNGGGTWSPITGATGTTYDEPAGLTTTTHYRRVTISTLNLVPCETPTSAVIVTVQSIVTAGVIGSSQTICNGGDPVAFTSTTAGNGSGTITYRWESSTNSGASWTTVTGATGATYDVPAGLSTTTQYRRITISTLNGVPCESVATTAVTVTVQGSATAGAIGSDQTICNGGNPAAFTSITAGSGSGTITYRWESSVNSGATWTTITGATADVYDAPAGLATTTHYRRVTISTLNLVPCETPTSAVIVTVQNTVTAGVIGSNQTICSGGDPVVFNSTTAGSGSGTVTYRWESSTNGGASWTAITGATGATYDVPAGLTTTTQYRRITISTLNGVPCESAVATTPVTVTVQSPVTAGAIGSDQTICSGGDPVAFTSTTAGTGSGTVAYRWEASTNGGTTWTIVSGATGATYDVPAGLTTTTQYRRITIATLNGVPCESGTTTPITVNVQSAVTAGAISASQTICNGGDPVAFTSTAAGTGSGTITYRWESSTNGGASWTIITGATGATYDVPAGLTTTTLYRRVSISTLNSIPCESATAAVTVTVRSIPTAGVIVTDQTICTGGDPAAFTSTTAGTGDGTISYRWESSTNAGATWSTIPGVTGTTYDVPSGLSITTQYRRITLSTLSSLTCESNAAKAITVTVQSEPTAGTVGSDTTICSGDNPSSFISKTAGTGDGAISYRWESSINGGVSWSTIPGITSAIYDVPVGLTVSSQYRRITISTLNAVACESKATVVIKIKVNPLPTATAFSNSPVCTRGKLSLRSNGGKTYEWFGPKGYTSKQQNNLILNVDSNYLGNYTVWVTDTNQCKDDFTINVDIKPGFRVSARSNSPVCTNDTLKFFGDISSFNKSTYSYEWVAKSFYSNVQNPVIDQVDSSRDGVYRFVAISANGCTDTTTTTPTILRPPLIKFVTNSPECVGQKAVLYNAFKSGTSLTWRKPDGTTVTTDTLKIASLKLSDAGFYRLTVRDSRGCRNQDSIKYTVNALPKITVSGDSKLCTGSTLKLNVTGTINYRWTGPNGFLSFAANPTKTGVTMLDSGLYTVIGTNANLCRDTATWNVMINPAIPGLKIFGDSQVCLWEKLTLSTIANTKNYRYKWQTPNGEIYYNPKLVIPLNKQSYEGVYSVVVSDSNYYCKDSVTDYVWVGPRPMSDSSNSPVCAGDSLKLNAYGNSRWTWQWSGPLGFTSTSSNPKLAYVNSFNAGTYQVIGTDTLGCRDTLTENVKINDCMVIELFSDSVKCKGGSTGLARVVAMGGSGFYQYKWLTSPARFNDTLKNISKGTYTVVVTDLKTGIVRIDSVKVGEPANVLSASIVIDSLICRDSSNAKLTCKASGGTTPYGYKWNGNVLLNNSVLQKVGAGSHSVVVTDRRGCMDTADVTVVNPKRWVITKSRDNVLCAGGNTGQASIVVSGGKPAYFYQWDTVTWVSKTKAISSVYKNLKAGIYKVLITDANNCQQTDTVMIAQPDSIKVSFTIDNYIRCYGDTSGQITSFPKGGVAGYTYLWNYNKKYTAKVAKNLPAGWYVLQLRDGNNCLKVDSILLSQPDDIKTKVSVLTHLKCYKDKSGAAEVSVTGGVTPYYVKWDNGGYTAQGFARNYMDAGDHWVYIRDFQGCYDTLKLTLNQPDSIITLFKTRRNVLCYNGNTGWAEFELAGGKAPFTYVWENGNTTKRATGLQATSYWMRAVDSNGCKYTDTIQMAQPPELDVYVKRMDSVTCFGLSDGGAELSAVGGKKPYGFWYFTGKDTVKGPNLTGVPARQFPAKYDGYVRDSNGCVDYTPVFIKEPLKLQVKRNGQVELICYGAATASVAVGPMGGNGGYTYSWNSFPKQYNAIATKLKAGVYIVTLKDYKGCTALDTFTIKQPAKNPIVTNPVREFCLKRTMNLTAAQFGADTAWWYNPAGLYIGNAYPTFTKTNATLSDSGNYTLIVKDKQGCNDTAKIKVIVHKLPVVSAWIQQPASHCKSDTITFRSSGAVNYSWNGPNGFVSSVQNPVISGLTLPMDGWYYVQGTDNNTCQSRDSVRLNIENNISIAKNQDICAGSNLVLSGFGAEKYRWAGPYGYGSTLQSPIIMDVEDSMSGRYTLFARDKYGCKDTLFTDILIYPRPYINPNANEPVCAGEPLSLFSKGGGNYQYTWTGPLGYSSTSANPVINTSTQSQTGNYNVYASYQADAVNVCRDSAFVYAQVFGLPVSAFMLTPKSAVYLTETEYELVDFSKNAVSWTYYMDDNYLANGPNAKFTLTEAGVRVFKQVVQSKDVSVYSAGYCTDSSDQVVKIEYKPKLWMPNAFTPNNNNKNDLLYPVGVNITEYRLRIFDQWGSKIFDELNGKWSGYDVNDKPYPVGVYIVYVTYKDITGLERELKNNVTLLR